MSRSEIYDKIKKYSLQNECLKKFGRNFTMCKTADLMSVVTNYENRMKKKLTATSNEEKPAAINKPMTEELSRDVSGNSACVDLEAREAVKEILKILYYQDIIDDDEVEKINSLFKNTVTVNHSDTESPYTDKELGDILAGAYK